MRQGSIPLFLIICFSTALAVGQSFSDRDTLKLQQVEVFDEFIEEHRSYTRFEFDSNQYAAFSLDAGEFLNRSTGIYVKDYGPGTTSSLTFRGNSANHTKVYWEGMSVDNVMLGQSDLSLYSLGSGTTSTFLKGSHSLDLGSGGFGGALNLAGENEEWDGLHLSSSFQYGTYNSRAIPLNLTLGNGRWRFSLNMQKVSSENGFDYIDYLGDEDVVRQRENAAFDRLLLIPELSYRLNQHTDISFSHWYTESDRQVPSPIGITHGNARQVDRWNRSMIKVNHIYQKFRLKFRSVYSVDEMYYNNDLLGLDSDHRIESFRNMIDLGYDIHKNILIRTQLRHHKDRVNSTNYDGNPLRDVVSVYPSVTYHHVRYYATASLRSEDPGDRRYYNMPSLDMGIMPFANLNDFWVFANATSNARFPTFNELYWQDAGNAELSNEKAVTYELSLEKNAWSTEKSKLQIHATYFHSEVSDMIAWFPGGNGVWKPKNLNAVLNKGLDAQMSFKLNNKNLQTSVSAGYVYTSSTIMSNPELTEIEGKQQMYVPMHKVYTNLNFSFRKCFLNYNQNYTGEVFVSTDNESFLPYNVPAELELGRRFKAVKSLFVASFRIRNLFNENYQYVAHQPMPLRHYLISLTIHIN